MDFFQTFRQQGTTEAIGIQNPRPKTNAGASEIGAEQIEIMPPRPKPVSTYHNPLGTEKNLLGGTTIWI